DGRRGVVRIGARAIARERAAVAVAVDVRAGERRVRTARRRGDDRREVDAEGELVHAADDEAVALVMRRRSPLGMRIESDRESGRIVQIASTSVFLRNERALKSSGVVFRFGER